MKEKQREEAQETQEQEMKEEHGEQGEQREREEQGEQNWDGFFLFDENVAKPLSIEQWAKYVAFVLIIQKKFQSNKKKEIFMYERILTTERQPVFTRGTWRKIISQINTGQYSPPLFQSESEDGNTYFSP